MRGLRQYKLKWLGSPEHCVREFLRPIFLH